MNDFWENRFAPRSFNNTTVNDDYIEKISKAIVYAPQQGGSVNHWWLCLGPQQHELKLWLVKNIYKAKFRKGYEYFPAIAEAPYLFTSFLIDDISKNADVTITHTVNNSFIGGVILSQAIDLGLHALPIICADTWTDLDESIKSEYKELMFEKVKKDVEHIVYAHQGQVKNFTADSIIGPGLNIAIGYGDNPHTMNKQDAEYLDGVVRYQKIRKSERMFSISL